MKITGDKNLKQQMSKTWINIEQILTKISICVKPHEALSYYLYFKYL